VGREFLEMEDVTFDGPGRAIAQLQILDEPLTQRRHESLHSHQVNAPGVSCGNYGTQRAIAQIGTTGINGPTPRLRRGLWLAELSFNACVHGWADYFCLGTVAKAYDLVAAYLCHRVRQWLVRKHKEQGSKRSRYSYQYLHDTLGLLRLRRRPNRVPWATA
jgi:hypothetical protein